MLINRLGKKLRKFMAKNLPKRGKSARNGNQPSPYTKYGKTEYKYSQNYREWKANRLAGRVTTNSSRSYRTEYREAAE